MPFILWHKARHTFCNPPGVLPASDSLAVHLDDGVASYDSQRQLILVTKQHAVINTSTVGCSCTYIHTHTHPSTLSQAVDMWAESGDIQYLYLLHQPVLFFVICLGELVYLDFVLLDFPHDLSENKRIFKQLQAEPAESFRYTSLCPALDSNFVGDTDTPDVLAGLTGKR